MSVAAHALEIGKTYKLGYDGSPFTVGSVDLEPRAPMANGKQRYYYETLDGNGVVTIAGEKYTEMPTPPPRLNLSKSKGPTYGINGGRRRKSRKARRAQKKRTRRSRR
jgi:hypothetical protein